MSNLNYAAAPNGVMVNFIKTSFGNILEWYDFTLYGLFAVALAKDFFPGENQYHGLLLVFLTFAMGFLVRPLGSVFFGWVGDNFGKRYAVNLAVTIMVIPTFIMGLLPTYATLGIFAPIILVVLRLLQGISAGGQFPGLVAIAVESEVKHQSFLANIVYSVSLIGSLIATFLGYISTVLISHYQPSSLFIQSLEWRLPFLFSIVLFIIYRIYRPDSEEIKSANTRFSLKQIIKKQPRELVYMVLLQITTGSLYYILFTYLITYLQVHLNLSKSLAFILSNLALFMAIILHPFFGYLVNNYHCRIRQGRIFVGLMLLSTVIFSFNHYSLWLGIGGMLLLVALFCAIAAFMLSLYAELFAPSYRMMACSLSYDLGVTCAGFAPLVAEFFSNYSQYGLPILLGFILIVLLFMLNLIKQTNSYQALLLNKIS